MQSGGSLSNHEQQFGPWLRASQYNSSKKIVVEVQGYGQTRATGNQKEGQNQARRDMVGVSQKPPRTVEDSSEPPVCKSTLIESEKSGTQSLTKFSATLQELNEAIHSDGGFQISNGGDRVMNVGSGVEILDMEAELVEQQNPQHEESPLFQREKDYVDNARPIFTPGWATVTRGKKVKKGGPSNTNVLKTNGPLHPTQELGPQPKGTWTKITRSKTESEGDVKEKGPRGNYQASQMKR